MHIDNSVCSKNNLLINRFDTVFIIDILFRNFSFKHMISKSNKIVQCVDSMSYSVFVLFSVSLIKFSVLDSDTIFGTSMNNAHYEFIIVF